jgi:UDP-N-acetylmuramoyl-tripeptide--D-alanyl-D-alanine ligase
MSASDFYALISDKDFTISTDTRTIQPGDIFFALKGEQLDGHEYAQTALDKGAAYAVISNAQYNTSDRCILVEDTLVFLQELAKLHRKRFSIPIIAIGGSNGKTTTKELLHAVLSKKYSVHTTKGNLNNDIGVPLTILGLKKEHTLAIIEVGANHPKEHVVLMHIVCPTHILVTNNGADHLEGFGSLEGVRSANKEIFDEGKHMNAYAFVNKDHPDLLEDSNGMDRTLYPESDVEKHSDLYAGVVYKDVLFKSQLFGSYNEENILAALTVGEYFNVPLEDCKDAIKAYSPTLKRSQVIKHGSCKIILDCYNANPTSMELSLKDFFKTAPIGNRLIMIGDMLEVGSTEHEAHRNILSLVQKSSQSRDHIMCVGPRFNAFKDEYPFLFFIDSTMAREHFNTLSLTDTTLFLKASRGIRLEDVIKEKISL